MRRVRVRAVAFHAGDETKSPGRGPPGKAGRVTNFTYGQIGPLIHVFGKNWEVSDCDLYASDKVRSPNRELRQPGRAPVCASTQAALLMQL